MTEHHQWTNWTYCPEFPNHRFSRLCMLCGTIEMTNKPCEDND